MKETKPDEKKPRQERGNPEFLLIAPNNKNYSQCTPEEIYHEIKKGKNMKYIFQNQQYRKEEIKDMVTKKLFNITAKDIHYLEVIKFNQIANGTCTRIGGKK